jgi:hypothetical protein
MEFGLISGKLRNPAATPSAMNINEPTPDPRRLTSPEAHPISYVRQRSPKRLAGRDATRFSRAPRSLTPIPTTPSETAETLAQDRRAVRFSDSDDDSLSSSSEDSATEAPGLIPKPRGQAGRPQSGGYNLQETLGWSKRTYDSVIVSNNHQEGPV